MNPLHESTRIAVACHWACRRSQDARAGFWNMLLFAVLACCVGSPDSVNAQFAHKYDWSHCVCKSEFPLVDPDAIGRDLGAVRSSLETATGLVFPESPLALSLFATRKRYVTYVSLEAQDARRQRGIFL